jgi:hypothetical protein
MVLKDQHQRADSAWCDRFVVSTTIMKGVMRDDAQLLETASGTDFWIFGSVFRHTITDAIDTRQRQYRDDQLQMGHSPGCHTFADQFLSPFYCTKEL